MVLSHGNGSLLRNQDFYTCLEIMTSRISSEVCLSCQDFLSIYAVSTYHHALSEIAFHVPANISSCSMRVLQIAISNSYFIQLFRPIEQLRKNTTVSVFFTPALVSSNKYIKFILEIPIYKTFNIRSISTYHTIPYHNIPCDTMFYHAKLNTAHGKSYHTILCHGDAIP